MRNPGQLLPDHAAVLATLGRSTPAPPSQVPPGAVTRLDGTAAPGPGGMLTAPYSGRPCVWYRALTLRSAPSLATYGAGRAPLTPVLASDMGVGVQPAEDVESSAPFVVDGPAGPVLVDPARADIDTPVITVNTLDNHALVNDERRREWILEAGAPVFVCGPVAGGDPAVLRATPTDCLVVSARGEQYVHERARSSLAAGGGRFGGAPASSGRGLIYGVAAGAAVLLLAIVVVIVVLLG